ncbi:MAG TPA: glycosyl hydrolase family 65 protein [Candidatus Angelobacter sp.]|nr:glycosyl hydrolase family 65 protein [Candidatus Angelobacter sp.]
MRTSDPAWLLTEEGFTLAREHEVESLLAISNGYIGNRASLAEGSPLSSPATFAAGVFTKPRIPGAVPQLLTLPDWTGVRLWVEGHPLGMQEGQVLEHRRILNMLHGVLWREWRHRDPNGRETHLLSFRLASLADRHLLLQFISLTPQNYAGTVRLESSIELPPGVDPCVPSDWKTRTSAERPNVLPLGFRTPGDGKYTLAFAVAGQLLGSKTTNAKREITLEERRIVETFEATAEPGAECHLLRVVSVFTSRDTTDLPHGAVGHANSVFASGFSRPSSVHASRWRARWDASDIQVEGDDGLQRALRFSAYHLIGAANPDDPHVSIGARALTGEAYKGHVFWDTEIYMLPFYIHTHPPSARALLTYRYHTLAAARDKARAAGFGGAMYPWESADTGEETTPRAIISPSGEVIEVLNGEMEIHITADIAFAIWQYWQATEDDEFLRQFGAEIMLETARFWASRGALESDGAYHIRHVIGPDEYHENVDDNVYTNLMAAWNLRHGVQTARILRERWPETWRELSGRLGISHEELLTWLKLAEATFTAFNPETALFEQFTGYFQKEPIDLKSYEPRSAAMDVILGHGRIQQTNVVKQADVVMATYLLWDDMPAKVRSANFHYYEPRTGHGSSLSPAMHALVAARLGEMSVASRYLRQASEIDLSNNMGNAAGGVHAAAMGGLWQAMVFGFAGVQPRGDSVAFTPNLLSQWQRLAFPFQWRNRLLHVSIDSGGIRVALRAGKSIKLRFGDGMEFDAEPGREYGAKRSDQNSWMLVTQS